MKEGRLSMMQYLLTKVIAIGFLVVCLAVLVWAGYDVAMFVHEERNREDWEEDYYDDD